jgi:hypothetical protein
VIYWTLAVALAAAAPAQAAQTSPEAQEEPQPERKICRTDRATGSLTRRTRICLTETQWRELNDRTRRGFQDMTSSASGGKECIIDPAGGCR